MQKNIVMTLIDKANELLETSPEVVQIFTGLKSGISNTAAVDYVELFEENTLVINGTMAFDLKDISIMKVW